MINENVTRITEAIINAPRTFYNLCLTQHDGVEILGPTALGKREHSPRYSFSDELIAKVTAGGYQQVASADYEICGEVFGVTPRVGEGLNALNLMMLLGRADLIAPTNYSEGFDLTAWRVQPETINDFVSIATHTGTIPLLLKSGIADMLRPDSKLEAGKSLYLRIVQNYR